MSTLAARIDRFVRWFFNVSPETTEIAPQPPRRRTAAPPRHARPASPKDRRDARPSAQRRDKRAAPARPVGKESA